MTTNFDLPYDFSLWSEEDFILAMGIKDFRNWAIEHYGRDFEVPKEILSELYRSFKNLVGREYSLPWISDDGQVLQIRIANKRGIIVLSPGPQEIF